MASRSHAQGKLNQVVEIIGEALDSEVCSIYLLREGMLELFATRGLEQSAVHVTKLAVGAGLTGTIAQNIETLNLAEAATHPEFQYMPETGEERFHSFAGVPIVRRQRRTSRSAYRIWRALEMRVPARAAPACCGQPPGICTALPCSGAQAPVGVQAQPKLSSSLILSFCFLSA
jgi:hypothetical protein